MVITRIGVASAAKVAGLLYVAIGLFIGLVFAGLSLVGAGIAGQNPDAPAWIPAVFGVGALLFAPIFYGAIGVIVGAIVALVYNWIAGAIGGLEIEIR